MSPNLLKPIGNPNILASESSHSHVYWCIQRSAMHLGGMTALYKVYLFLLCYEIFMGIPTMNVPSNLPDTEA